MEHDGHQRPFLLGQALCRIEEEITSNGRKATPARGALGWDDTLEELLKTADRP